MLGFGLFILACTGWMSWSPDGSQMVFGYWDPNVEQFRIALYRMGSARARALNPKEFSEGDTWLSAQWKRDGSALFVFRNSKDENGNPVISVMEVSVPNGEVLRQVNVPAKSDSTVPIPPVEVQNALFIVLETGITRIDLATLELKKSDETGEAYIYSLDADRVYYVRQDTDDNNLELGYVDPQTMAFNHMFKITMNDPRFREGELKGLPAADPKGTRFAFASTRKDRDDIAVLNQAGVERIFTPKFPFKKFHIGNMKWSPDGKHLYAGVINPVRADVEKYSVADIDMDSGEATLFPIAEIHANSDFRDSFGLWVQVELSPDGRTIATSTANLKKELISDKDRALYLIDIGGKGDVRSVPAPVLKKRKK